MILLVSTKGELLARLPFTTVQSLFNEEVSTAYRFLVSEFGMEGPTAQGVVLPTIVFAGPDASYRIMLDTDEKAVVTRLEVGFHSGRLVADLVRLVHAAGLDAANKVRTSARTLHELRATLES